MIWTFRRSDATVRLRTYYDITSHEFVLEMTWSDRPQTTERFRTIRKFKARVLEVEHELAAAHWTQIASPETLPDDAPRSVIH